jgi:hypothetical protein
MYIQYREHRATRDAHKEASGTTNGTINGRNKKDTKKFSYVIKINNNMDVP